MSKENINNVEDKALSIINKLKVVEYNQAEHERVRAGLIPEDSEDVATEDGEAISLSTQVNYNTKAIQEIYEILEQYLNE